MASKLVAMKATHQAIARGFAKHAEDQVKVAMQKTANRRWLEDSDLIKLCKLFKQKQPKR